MSDVSVLRACHQIRRSGQLPPAPAAVPGACAGRGTWCPSGCRGGGGCSERSEEASPRRRVHRSTSRWVIDGAAAKPATSHEAADNCLPVSRPARRLLPLERASDGGWVGSQ